MVGQRATTGWPFLIPDEEQSDNHSGSDTRQLRQMVGWSTRHPSMYKVNPPNAPSWSFSLFPHELCVAYTCQPEGWCTCRGKDSSLPSSCLPSTLNEKKTPPLPSAIQSTETSSH
ncbi:unnamed protein product [Leuciscus chuanchicus]